MAYLVYIDGVALPVTPSKIQTKINNKNETITLINEGEVNILKSPGLTDVQFKTMIPHVRFPFARYEDGFKDSSYFLDKFEALKTSKKPFQFLVSRTSPDGSLLFDTNLKVSLEDYTIDEEASEGQSLMVNVKLKQYRDYGTKTLEIREAPQTKLASVQSERPTESAPVADTYTVVSGDTLWNIAKKKLGDGSKYTDIAKLNDLANPNLIYPGQVLKLS